MNKIYVVMKEFLLTNGNYSNVCEDNKYGSKIFCNVLKKSGIMFRRLQQNAIV